VLTVTLPIGVDPLVGPMQMLKFEMDVVMFVVPVKTEFWARPVEVAKASRAAVARRRVVFFTG
jgi:hypothetical protein